MFEFLHYGFMRNALLAAVLASIACGIIGAFVIVKKIVSISGAISHCAFGGIGLGYFLRIDPILAVVPFSVLSAIGIGLVTKKTRIAEDTSIGIFWAVSMAIGVILIGLTPGYTPDLFSYLFGNILTVPLSDIYLMIILDIIIIFIVTLFYKEFVAISFDEEYAAALGLPILPFYLLLLSLVAFTVVVMIRIVGIILVIAMLTLPAAIAKQFTYNLKKMIFLSIFIGIIFTLIGLWISYVLNLPAGATIILLLGFAFILTAFVSKIVEKIKVGKTQTDNIC